LTRGYSIEFGSAGSVKSRANAASARPEPLSARTPTIRSFGRQIEAPRGAARHRLLNALACKARPPRRRPFARQDRVEIGRPRSSATVLDKELKRQVTVDGVDYTVAIDPEGFRMTGKGRRRPQVELRWRDLLSGDAAMAVALNASLSKKRQPGTTPATQQSPDRASKRVTKKPQR